MGVPFCQKLHFTFLARLKGSDCVSCRAFGCESLWRCLESRPSAAARSDNRGREVATGVVDPRYTVHRRRREVAAPARVAVPDAASAVGRGRAEAPAVRPVNPGLLLGERLGADEG